MITDERSKVSRDDILDRKRDNIERETTRTERVSLHKQNAVTILNPEPGYHYRMVNDVYGRIDRFIKAGWEIVEDSIKNTQSGQGRDVESQAGSQVTRVVNKGEKAPSNKAYLMRIPEELFEADQQAKQDAIDALEKEHDPYGLIRKAQLMGSRSNLTPEQLAQIKAVYKK